MDGLKDRGSSRIEITYTDYPNGSETLVFHPEMEAFVIEKWVTKAGAIAWLEQHRENIGDQFELSRRLTNECAIEVNNSLESSPHKKQGAVESIDRVCQRTEETKLQL